MLPKPALMTRRIMPSNLALAASISRRISAASNIRGPFSSFRRSNARRLGFLKVGPNRIGRSIKAASFQGPK